MDWLRQWQLKNRWEAHLLQAPTRNVSPMCYYAVAEVNVSRTTLLFHHLELLWGSTAHVQSARLTIRRQKNIVVVVVNQGRKVTIQGDRGLATHQFGPPKILEVALWRFEAVQPPRAPIGMLDRSRLDARDRQAALHHQWAHELTGIAAGRLTIKARVGLRKADEPNARV